VLDLIGAVGLKVVSTAMRAGVFTALESQAKTAEEVAESAGLDAQITRSLLRLLEALGYVRQKNSQFELTPMSMKWMLPTSDAPFGDFLRFYDEVVPPITL